MELLGDVWNWLVAWLGSNDPLRLSFLFANISVWFAYWWPALVLLFIACLILFSKHSTIAVWTPSISIGQWFAKMWAKTPMAKRRMERDMRVEQDRMRHFDLMEDIADLIETKVDNGVWDREDADVEYTKLKKRFPPFVRCVENPVGVREYFKQLREEMGKGNNVIVLPTKGGAAPAPTILKHRK